jgi:hypothetical protein
MVVGFNHNFRYKGEVYHVQTEDGGRKSPHIITLLYRGGAILASRKTSYADIAKADHLEKVVEELMKEQHREMLRRLKSGDLDALLHCDGSPVTITPEASSSLPLSEPAAPSPTAAPPPAAAPSPSPAASSPPASSLPPATPAPAKVSAPRSRPVESSLDEIILSYLVEDEEQR